MYDVIVRSCKGIPCFQKNQPLVGIAKLKSQRADIDSSITELSDFINHIEEIDN